MTKFAKVVVVVGILALVPIVAFVRWAIVPVVVDFGGNDLEFFWLRVASRCVNGLYGMLTCAFDY
jgi:hypothetical protein